MIRHLSKGSGGYDSHNDDHGNRQLFDGFPFFVTRIVPGLHNIILLPIDMDVASLIEFSEHQAHSNDLEACLVLSNKRVHWFIPEGGKSYAHQSPWGGVLITGGLKTCKVFYPSPELEERAKRLEELVKEYRQRGGFIRGDSNHGGRPASEQELDSLSGEGLDVAPKGLDKCPTCGGWKGDCLGTFERYKTSVLPVHCQCDNHNRCARCGDPLHEHKLNSNIFEPSDGQIRYVPGFACFGHVCPDHG